MEKKKRKTGRPMHQRNRQMWRACISHGVGRDFWIVPTDLVVIQGNLNGVRYRDEILQQQVEPFMQNHPEEGDVSAWQHSTTHCQSLHSIPR